MEPIHHSFFDEKPSSFMEEHRMHYLMINAVARRVRQLQTGERALALPSDGNREAVNIAIHEFKEDELEIVPRRVAVLEAAEEELLAPDTGDDYDFDIGAIEPAADGEDL